MGTPWRSAWICHRCLERVGAGGAHCMGQGRFGTLAGCGLVRRRRGVREARVLPRWSRGVGVVTHRLGGLRRRWLALAGGRRGGLAREGSLDDGLLGGSLVVGGGDAHGFSWVGPAEICAFTLPSPGGWPLSARFHFCARFLTAILTRGLYESAGWGRLKRLQGAFERRCGHSTHDGRTRSRTEHARKAKRG